MKQFMITPAMGKRLIGKAVAARADVQAALTKGTIVIVAGTTNARVAQEILASAGIETSIQWSTFYRGMVAPTDAKMPKGDFGGDVILVDGRPQEGKQIFDFAGRMGAGDIFIKGANAVDVANGEAAALIGHPECGTAGALLPAVIGRRAKLIVPVGLEKRVDEPIVMLAGFLNDPDSTGPRMLPLPGEVVTELDAIEFLTGADAVLIAGGGICGAEGASWVGVSGDDEDEAVADELISSLAGEKPWPGDKKD